MGHEEKVTFLSADLLGLDENKWHVEGRHEEGRHGNQGHGERCHGQGFMSRDGMAKDMLEDGSPNAHDEEERHVQVGGM